MRHPTAGEACSRSDVRLTYVAAVCMGPICDASRRDGSTSLSKRAPTSLSLNDPSPCAAASAFSNACFTNLGPLPRWKTRKSCASTNKPPSRASSAPWHAARHEKYTSIEPGPSTIGPIDGQPTGL